MPPQPDIPLERIRRRCRTLLRQAEEEAQRLAHDYIGVEHLFIALIRQQDGQTTHLLRRAGLDPREVRNAIREEVGKGEGSGVSPLILTPRTGMILSLAIILSNHDADETSPIDEKFVLMAILQEGESIPVRKLNEIGFKVDDWLHTLLNEEHYRDHTAIDENDGSDGVNALFDEPNIDFSYSRDSFLSQQSGQTVLLDKFGRDLMVAANKGIIGAAIAREREIKLLAQTLARSKKNNPLLLGDAGVGKTAVVEGLAYAIKQGSAPASLRDKRIVQIEIGTLVAGTSLRGQFEERLIGIIEEAQRAGNVILFIDEIHTIVGAGDTIDSNLDAANILKPALARGEIMVIGATTHEEYRRAIAKDPALDRRFRTIDIEEPGIDDTIAILQGQRERLERHHGVSISDPAIAASVRLSIRYLPARRLPDKALDLIDEACARVTVQTLNPQPRGTDPLSPEAAHVVNVETITAVLAEWTNIPVQQLSDDERQRINSLETALLKRVIGQDDAVRTLSSAIKTARAGLNDPKRPVGVFLFLGPSGVGKTDLARSLADFLFSSEDAMIRLDMSEFHDAHTVARLIGSPPGYRDQQNGGQLTDALRRRPYSVVLLDEVEKAAPEVFDIFLQVFDEGRLSDARGGRVDARNAVFIMTSNIGSDELIKSAVSFTPGELRTPDYLAGLQRHFRPEFLNRVDEVIVFRPLARAALQRILDLQLAGLYERLRDQGYRLELTEAARDRLLSDGYHPQQGARPLRRAIDRLLIRPLSQRLLEGVFSPGAIIRADASAIDPAGLIFEPATSEVSLR